MKDTIKICLFNLITYALLALSVSEINHYVRVVCTCITCILFYIRGHQSK